MVQRRLLVPPKKRVVFGSITLHYNDVTGSRDDGCASSDMRSTCVLVMKAVEFVSKSMDASRVVSSNSSTELSAILREIK